MKRIGVILLFSALTAGISAQNADINAVIDTSSILIGDQIHLRITVTAPEGCSVKVPVLRGTIADKVLILGLPVRDSSVNTDGTRKISDDYLITSFDEGTFDIDSLSCEIQNETITETLYTDKLSLTVTRPSVTPADTSDAIFDIVSPRKAPIVFAELLPWIIIVIAVALVVWVLVRYLPRKPFARIIKNEVPVEPAHITAVRELDKLRKEELWQKGEVKEYYSRLSDILRRYVDGRFNIQSPELTTDETVRMLQRSGFVTSELLQIVKSVLSDSDMVKFAKFKPESDQNITSIDKAAKFVDLTRPHDMPEAGVASSEKKGGGNE